jgi:hypothetical protein
MNDDKLLFLAVLPADQRNAANALESTTVLDYIIWLAKNRELTPSRIEEIIRFGKDEGVIA